MFRARVASNLLGTERARAEGAAGPRRAPLPQEKTQAP
jgi:hypothetical protein